jgi:quercetin dioxygenase-like cupin family protein
MDDQLRATEPETPFAELAALAPTRIWEGVAGRVVHGERVTLTVIELDPASVVPEHSHENEQVGVMLSGSLTFRIGSETRALGPGATWCIPGNTPHEVRTGPEGAVVVEVFAPPRVDWAALEREEPRHPRWPAPS